MLWLLLIAGKRKRASQDKSGATFYNLIQDITLIRVAKWAACPTQRGRPRSIAVLTTRWVCFGYLIFLIFVQA